MSHPASECNNNHQTSESLIPRCKLILFRWFSSLKRLILSDKDELLKNDKHWKQFPVAEMVENLFSENPAMRACALRKTRQLMMAFPDRLVFNIIRIRTPPKLVDGMRIFSPNRRLKAALASVILQFEQQIGAFVSGLTPMVVVQLFYPDVETICSAFCAWRIMRGCQHRELDCLVQLGFIKSIARQTNPNTPLTVLRHQASMVMELCELAGPSYPECVYEAMIPAFKYLMKQTDTEVNYFTGWAVDAFTSHGNKHRDLFVYCGMLPHLMHLISHSSGAHFGLYAVNRFTRGTDEQKQAVWNCGFLNHIPNILQYNNSQHCYVTVFDCLSDLAAGNRELLCALLDRGLFSPIKNHAVHGSILALTAGDLMKHDKFKKITFKVGACLLDVLLDRLNDIRFDNSVTLHTLSKLLSNVGSQLGDVKYPVDFDFLLILLIARLEELHWSVNDDESRLSYHIMEDHFS